MIESDKRVYEKMIGIWSITRIPQLEMTPTNGEGLFRWSMGPAGDRLISRAADRAAV